MASEAFAYSRPWERRALYALVDRRWTVAIDTAAREWGGPGAGIVSGSNVVIRAHSAMLLTHEGA